MLNNLTDNYNLDLRFGRLTYYSIVAVCGVSTILFLLLLPSDSENSVNQFKEPPLISEVEATSAHPQIDHQSSLSARAGDAVSPKKYLIVYDSFIDTERHCEHCIRIEYVPGPEGVAGMAFQNEQGLDFKPFKKVTFYIMGLEGGEVIKFKAAGKTVDSSKVSSKEIFKNVKFDKTTKDVTLSKDWKKMEIDLSNSDLKEITHPFGFQLSNDKNKANTVFYLKGVTYDLDDAKNALPLETITEGCLCILFECLPSRYSCLAFGPDFFWCFLKGSHFAGAAH